MTDGAAARPRTAGSDRSRRRRTSSIFAIGGSIKTSQYVLFGAITFAALLIIWWLVTALGAVQPLFLPSPGAVLTRLGTAAADGQLWLDAGVSIYRIVVGFVIATVLALPIGVAVGSYPAAAGLLEPLMDFVRYMPVVAFVPLSIVWVGTSDTQKFLIIFLGTFFQQVLLFADTVKRVPTEFVSIARTLGLPERKIISRVVVPAAAPGLWDSGRITLGWAWTWLVVAELVAATTGLGYRITTAQRYFQTDTIIGYILVLGLLGLITDQTLRFVGRMIFRYLEVRT
ncbi:ABC transporter permease [Microlunatus soli]|uniref:NitT/TauT family transport system permease protein n=1 Tax=Microlunatus soli TaxID=630515 RepID=A0A1H1RTH1_9ACTN|nr:ABC transporter permease [Microlunatus soli]SDS39002.1 NitT/TauT family transport system permease protein [Microlunatus soli]